MHTDSFRADADPDGGAVCNQEKSSGTIPALTVLVVHALLIFRRDLLTPLQNVHHILAVFADSNPDLRLGVPPLLDDTADVQYSAPRRIRGRGPGLPFI